MFVTDASAPALVSECGDDPDLREIVGFFVDDLARRADAIETALATRDLARLRILAHQLRGSAGGYGFPTIGYAAAELERRVTDGASPDGLRAAAATLVDRCRRAVARPAGGCAP